MQSARTDSSPPILCESERDAVAGGHVDPSPLLHLGTSSAMIAQWPPMLRSSVRDAAAASHPDPSPLLRPGMQSARTAPSPPCEQPLQGRLRCHNTHCVSQRQEGSLERDAVAVCLHHPSPLLHVRMRRARTARSPPKLCSAERYAAPGCH